MDYNATTPLDPAVQAEMARGLSELWGNPSSVHHIGRQARAILDQARERAAAVLGCRQNELVFTSGGTESCNLAVLGTARRLKPKGRHLVTSSIEHPAVLHPFKYLEKKEGFEVTYLPVDRKGKVPIESLEGALRNDTTLVSIMAANNEIGTIQPIAQLGALCRGRGIVFHTDAIQWFGKAPFQNIHQFGADLVSLCAHKIHGPKGAGLLFARSPLHPDPIVLGGGQENERRAGTENLTGIMGLVTVLERFVREPVFPQERLRKFTDELEASVRALPEVHLVGREEAFLPNTISFVVEGTDSIALLAALDLEGVCASSGSACATGSVEPSHVIAALGMRPDLAKSLVRFSLGRETTQDDVDFVRKSLPGIIRRAQNSQ